MSPSGCLEVNEMETSRVDIFIRVVQRGSLTAAARELHLAQSSVSGAIDKLEEEWGVPLLERHGRLGIRPTTAGKLLYRRGKEILEIVHKTHEELLRIARGDGAEILLATCPGPLHTLSGLLRDLRAEHPGLSVSVRSGLSADIVRWVRSRSVHAGLAWGPLTDPGLLIRTLSEPKFDFFVGSTHPLAGRTQPLSLEVISRYDLIIDQSGSSTAQYLKSLLAQAGLVDIHFTEVGDLGAVKEMVLAGMGVGFAAADLIVRERKLNFALTLDVAGIDVHRPLLLITPKDEQDPGVETVCAYLAEHMKDPFEPA